MLNKFKRTIQSPIVIALMVLGVFLVLYPVYSYAAAPTASYVVVPSGGVYPTVVYSVTVDYTDPDGAADIDSVYLRLSQGDSENQLSPSLRQTLQLHPQDTSPGQYLDEVHRLFVVSATTTGITNGYQVTWTFRIGWGWEKSSNVDLYVYVQDKSGVLPLSEDDLLNVLVK